MPSTCCLLYLECLLFLFVYASFGTCYCELLKRSAHVQLNYSCWYNCEKLLCFVLPSVQASQNNTIHSTHLVNRLPLALSSELLWSKRSCPLERRHAAGFFRLHPPLVSPTMAIYYGYFYLSCHRQGLIRAVSSVPRLSMQKSAEDEGD